MNNDKRCGILWVGYVKISKIYEEKSKALL